MSDKTLFYPHKTSRELRASLLLFRLLSYPLLVRLSLILWKCLELVRFPISPFIHLTGYYQFCAGKDVASCNAATSRLAAFNVKSVLDYANEHAKSEADFSHNLDVILKTIHAAANNDAYPFAVLKPTALGAFSLYEKMSNGLELSNLELAAWQRIKMRLEACAALAAKSKIVLMIDAEESWIQPGVDALIFPLMKSYNKKQVVVAITLQLYLKGVFDRYKQLTSSAENYFLGVKLVRGAYMEKERKRAEILGIPSPVNDTKAQTDMQYRQAMALALKNINRNLCIIATHNEADIEWVKQSCNREQLVISHKNLWFSQLYGMRDYVSFSIAKQGANVFKYVPFGPLGQSIPYLTRRAIENSAMKSQTTREQYMIKQELAKRKTNV